MQLIEKSKVLEILEKYGSIVGTKAGEELDALPIHTKEEYEIGKEYECFNEDSQKWEVHKFAGYATFAPIPTTWSKIRPLSESPEILSARSLLEEAGFTVTKK